MLIKNNSINNNINKEIKKDKENKKVFYLISSF